MKLIWDPINIINIFLCALIFVLGWWSYQKKKDNTFFFIGIAFGLFGVSHLLTFFGLRESLESLLLIVRIIAYLTVVLSLVRLTIKEKEN